MSDIKPINPQALLVLKARRARLTPQQYRTLRGQVLAGDDVGALKGLHKILRRGREEVSRACK